MTFTYFSRIWNITHFLYHWAAGGRMETKNLCPRKGCRVQHEGVSIKLNQSISKGVTVLCLRFLGGALSSIPGRTTNLESTGIYSWQLPAQFINMNVALQYNLSSKYLTTPSSSNHVASRTEPRCTSRKLHSLPPRHPPHWTR